MEVGTAVTASDVVAKVTKPVVDPFWRQIWYIWNYGDNIQILKDEVQKLKDRRATVQHQVEEATRNGEAIEDEVMHWLARVDENLVAAEKILEDNDAAKQRCFIGCRPSLKSRHHISRNAFKKTYVVDVVRGEGSFGKISYRTALDVVPVEDYKASESRTAIISQMVEALKDTDVNMIGLYGMGGVGKTTLAKKVAEGVKKDGIFTKVAISTVTQNVDLKRIQQDIAELLGFKLKLESTVARAALLYSQLVEQKILLILDDIWDTLKLEDIGIPKDHRGCKLLITSRDLDVLRRMGIERIYSLETLVDEEANQYII